MEKLSCGFVIGNIDASAGMRIIFALAAGIADVLWTGIPLRTGDNLGFGLTSDGVNDKMTEIKYRVERKEYH